jgi:hypothetical protein
MSLPTLDDMKVAASDVTEEENGAAVGRTSYPENSVNWSLLMPSKFGWTAAGGIANLSTPYDVRVECILKSFLWKVFCLFHLN